MNYEGITNVEVIDGVNTSKSSLQIEEQEHLLQQYDKNLKFDDVSKFSFYKPGQIGCYIGHHLAVKKIEDFLQTN